MYAQGTGRVWIAVNIVHHSLDWYDAQASYLENIVDATDNNPLFLKPTVVESRIELFSSRLPTSLIITPHFVSHY